MSEKKNDGAPVTSCKWCLMPAYIKQGRIWLCKIHYRFSSMRANAKRHGKVVPSVELLDSFLTPDYAICKGCNRKMNWLDKDGKSTVITLQHDRNGTMRFLCRACNTRHANRPGDSFYDDPKNKKLCPDCNQWKEFNAFSIDRHFRWMDRKTYCKECSNDRHKRWRETRIAA